MKILITGGGGFLGQRVARELLANGMKTGPGGAAVPVSAITLYDIANRRRAWPSGIHASSSSRAR